MIFEPEKWERPTPEEMYGYVVRPNPPKGSLLVFRKHLSAALSV